MPVGNILMPLLGSLIGDATPQRNPNNKGQASIDPTTGTWKPGEEPYAAPGFGTKFFHPEVAQYEAGQNNELYNQALQELAQRRVGATRFGIAQPALTKQPNEWTPEQGSVLTGGNPTASNVNASAESTAELANNIPTRRSLQTGASLDELRRGSLARMEQGIPELSASTQRSSLGTEALRNQLETGILPSRYGLEQQQIGSESSLLPIRTSAEAARLGFVPEQIASERSVLPAETQYRTQAANTGTIQGKLAQELAASDIGNLPALKAARRNAAVMSEYESRFGQPSPAAFTPMVTGTSVSPLVRNPSFAGPFANISAITHGGGVGMNTGLSSAVRLPGGESLPMVEGAGQFRSSLAPQSQTQEFNPEATTSPGTNPSLIRPLNSLGPRVGMNPQEGNEENKRTTETTPESFLKTLRTGTARSGTFLGIPTNNEQTQNVEGAMNYIAKYLSQRIMIPQSRIGWVGGSTIPHSKVNYLKDALMGNNSDFNPQELLSSVPPEVLDEALKSAGYKK